nr:hypothetical protein Itr_chr03CG24050 [Ipomoea trifida]
MKGILCSRILWPCLVQIQQISSSLACSLYHFSTLPNNQYNHSWNEFQHDEHFIMYMYCLHLTLFTAYISILNMQCFKI